MQKLQRRHPLTLLQETLLACLYIAVTPEQLHLPSCKMIKFKALD